MGPSESPPVTRPDIGSVASVNPQSMMIITSNRICLATFVWVTSVSSFTTTNFTYQPTPSFLPTDLPSIKTLPTIIPTSLPHEIPLSLPSHAPTVHPSSSTSPTTILSSFPISPPISDPSSVPTFPPVYQLSLTPTVTPGSHPSMIPTLFPSVSQQPSSLPTPTPKPTIFQRCSNVADHDTLIYAISVCTSIELVDDIDISSSSSEYVHGATTGVHITDGVKCTIYGKGHSINGQNKFRLICIEGISELHLDSVVLKYGHAGSSAYGGGVYMAGGELILANCTLTLNYAASCGGAIFASAGSLKLINCTLSSNTAAAEGGSIYISAGSLKLFDCTLSNNCAGTYGGGICLNSLKSSVSIILFQISGGSVSNNVGKSQGGGIYASNIVQGSSFSLQNCDISNNKLIGSTSTSYGGGMYISTRSMFIIECCTVALNAVGAGTSGGDVGGGLYIFSGNITISRCNITMNRSPKGNGGGIYVGDLGSLHMTSSFVGRNIAGKPGTSCGAGSTTSAGGGLYIASSSKTFISDSIISENSGGSNGGGLYITSGSSPTSTFELETSQVTNNTVCSYGGGLYVQKVQSFVSRTSFNKNVASIGGGMYLHYLPTSITLTSVQFDDNGAMTQGGAMTLDNTAAVACDVSYFRNIGIEGGGVYFDSGSSFSGTGMLFEKNLPDDFGGTNGQSATCLSSCESGFFGICSIAVGAPSCYENCNCVACPAGKANPSPGAIDETKCVACISGQFSGAGNPTCEACSEGTYSPSDAAATCEICSEGTFSSSIGSTECKDCKAGLTSNAGDSGCLLAAPGYYLEPTTGRPLNCPPHMDCTFGGDRMPAPLKNYWVDRRKLDYVADVSPCNWKTCTGAIDQAGHISNFSCWDVQSYASNFDDVCDSDVLMCAEGSFGPKCGACATNYIFSVAHQKCSQCKPHISWLIFVIYALFALVMSNPQAFSWLWNAISEKLFLPTWMQRWWIVGMFNELDQGSVRVLISTYQIICSVSWNLRINLLPPFSTMLTAISFLSFDFIQARCLTYDSNLYSDVYVYAIAPIFLVGFGLCAHLVRKLFAHVIPTCRSNTSDVTFVYMLLTYLVLPPVSRVLFQALDCEVMPGSGDRRLRSDTSIDCDSQKYKAFVVVDGIFITVYMSIPLVWTCLLCKNRSYLNPKTSDIDAALRLRDEHEELKPLYFLYSIYQPPFYGFETVDMYRRIIFIGLLPLLSAKSARRAALGLVLALCSAILFRELEPYEKWSTNVIANMAQYAIFLTYGVALAVDTDLSHGVSDQTLCFFLAIINFSILGLSLAFGAQRHLREDQMHWQWRRMLTSQEFRIVNAVMEGRRNDATVDTQSQDSWNQGRDSALQTSCLSQYLLHASDVRLIKKVGNGAFGEVFKGTCLGQTVAVKTMRVVNDENVRCFRAEILLTATLRHPNIVNFVGACWGKELICLVLEWVPKGTLGDLLADVALDLRWDEPLLRLATDIARGMAYLHGREYYDERDKRLKRCILHRDLKPQNALVTEFSGAKLADFGSSRAKGTMDATMTAVGTPLYAAPELMRGEAYDETIDVYSFGILLIDMASYEGLSVFLRGRWCADAVDPKVVHPGEVDVRRVLLTMWDQGWRPVTAANGIPAAPPSVVALLQRCFAHDPRERPPFPEVLHVLTSVSTSDEAGAYRRVRPQAAADRDRTTLIARGSATTVDDLAVGRDGDRYSSRGSLASPRPSVQPSGNRASWNPIHQRGSEASDHRDLAGGIGPPPRTSMAPPPLRQPPLRQPPRSFFSRIGLFTGRRSTTEPVDPKEEPLLDSEQGGGGREPSPRRLMKIPFYRRAPRPEEVPLVNPEPTVSHL